MTFNSIKKKYLTSPYNILLIVFLLQFNYVKGETYVGALKQRNNSEILIKFPSNYEKFWNESPNVKQQLIRLDAINSNIEEYIYNHYSSIKHNPLTWFFKTRDLNKYTFSLKYLIPTYKPIQYSPAHIKQTFLPNVSLQRFNYFTEKELQNNFNPNYCYLEQNQDSLAIYRPDNITHIWEDIPSPHRFLLEGQKLHTKSIGTFYVPVVETIKKLKKPPKIVKYWNYSGEEIVQFSHNYNENWVKGGDESVNLLSDLRASANYKKKSHEWESKGKHRLGINQIQGKKRRINTDVIELSSKYGYKASKKWYYSALFNLKTQFFNSPDKNNDSIILSAFMSPGYITAAIGMDYKKSKNFAILLSPLSSKITTVLANSKVNPNRYKVPEGRKAITRSGASVNSHLKWKISNEYRLEYSFDLFYGYLNKDPDTQMDCEVIFNMRINRFFSTRVNMNFRYYQNESTKLQFKQNFSIAFSYRF